VGTIVVGILIGLLTMAAKVVLDEAVGDPGYIVLMAGVIVAAWVGGMMGGAVSVATVLLLNSLLFVEPRWSLATGDEADFAKQVIFLVIGLGTVLLIGSRRASRDRLADALVESAALAEAVATRDERLELVLQASGTGYWEWDIASGELLWSEAIFRHHGLDAAGTAPDFDAYLGLIHPDDTQRFRSAVSATVAGGADLDEEYRVVWPDGSVHWIHGVGRVFRDTGARPVRMIGTGEDTTEQRRLEEERDRLLAEERRAAEYREAFVDVISHELRTPITTILGLAQILAKPGRVDDPTTRVSLLEDVRAESERLHRLVEDLLVLSRVERGRLDVEAEPLEARRLLEHVVAAEATQLPSISITLEIEPDLPIVAGEATYVEQIIRNLLGNAAKYTPRGTRVVVSARREAGGVGFRVSDDGPGIPEASAERVFELFYRDPESARRAAGSGIGLFVCATLVQAMGGRIWAARRPEGGAEFGFLLRALESDEDLETAAPAGRQAPTTTGREPARSVPGVAPPPTRQPSRNEAVTRLQ
jgi:PAS domain S-box-containing protein